jgi:hypothetical protein
VQALSNVAVKHPSKDWKTGHSPDRWCVPDHRNGITGKCTFFTVTGRAEAIAFHGPLGR